MLMKVFEIANTYVDVAVPILTFIFGLITSKYIIFYKKYLLKKIIRVKRAKSNLVVPTRTGLLNDLFHTSLEADYITFNESILILEAQKILDELGTPVADLNLQRDIEKMDVTKNAFCLGGPLANKHVAAIFKTVIQGVKFSSHHFDDPSYSEFQDFLLPMPEDNLDRIQINGKTVLKYNRKNEGYIILIHLGKKDFKDADRAPMNIFFGNTAITTQAAMQCLSEHRKELYKRLKKNRYHYFVILPCDSDGVVNFREYLDVTNMVF